MMQQHLPIYLHQISRTTYALFIMSMGLWLNTTTDAIAQIGGNNIYEFLNLPASPRITAFGGNQISVLDSDVSMGITNPSLYNSEMNGFLSVNNASYFSDINQGYVGYAKHFDSLSINTTFSAGVQYISYGDFAGADATGMPTDNFNAGEYAFILGAGRKWRDFHYGANFKFISSNLENYTSLGYAVDAGITYFRPESNFSLAFVAKNIGQQLTTYDGGNEKELIPFELQLGLSKRLKYLPFRFSILAQNLQTWRIRYDDPNQQQVSIFGEPSQVNENDFMDNLMRHLVFSGELYMGKALRFRMGYNHLRRKEMAVDASRSFAGFSFGIGLHIKRLQLSYGRALHHLAGGTNHIGLGIRMGKL
ncbi:MAG: type IX secretion system protein PorQ [Chitinophagales bacterium]